MKLGKALSWMMGTLQRSLFPRLEECWQVPLTDKEQQVVSILELIKVEKEATFSRAFAEFSKSGLGDRVHETLVEDCLKPELIGHISRNSTAIEGREKPVRKPRKNKPAARKKGRPAKGEQREPEEKKRLERQQGLSAEEVLKELPVVRNVGTKKSSKGFKTTWICYKLHADVNDCGLPLSVALTSASVHDSQVAIPPWITSRPKIEHFA
jgi:hypothetical protein